MNDGVRIVVCGDEGVGKSSLITAFVKKTFIDNIQPQVPPLTVSGAKVTTTIVDTSADIDGRENLKREVRRANVVLLLYSDHYTCERVGLFWMNFLRSLGVSVPVILVAHKSDMYTVSQTDDTALQAVEEEVDPLLQEFREIELCVRCSSKEQVGVDQVFYLCQRAVTHPVLPLFDYKERKLKPAAESCLRRIFYLLDRKHTGTLGDEELQTLQRLSFGKELPLEHLNEIKAKFGVLPSGGLNIKSFLELMLQYAKKGRHETIWTLLRAYHYSDSLNLHDSFLYPK